MSLNGLDGHAVYDAYQGALANGNGGGWFLLNYVSRDEVEVLGRGTGGAAEARAAVAQYAEKSPLYGFLLYRRRKVLIKYIPEGTSRLLQARVTVHFSAVEEKFTPHDTTISITSADELSDSALAAACSLHTAVPSTCSSSGSSRSRRKLDEITEDAEEGSPAQPTQDAAEPPNSTRPPTAASSKPTITGLAPPDSSDRPSSSAASSLKPPASPSTLERSHTIDNSQVPLSQDTPSALPEDDKPEAKVPEYRESLKAYDELFKHGPDPRLSSQTARPTASDLYAEIYAQYNKPKVRLAPRLKQSFEGKRPHTSGSGSQNASRPVSTLPPGLRIANRKPPELKRPKSRDSSVVPSIAFPPPPPVPVIPEMPLPSPRLSSKSPASVRSMPLPSHSIHGPRSPGITPEKQRLMKALEMRKKQMLAKEARKQTQNGSSLDHVATKDQSAPLNNTIIEEEAVTPEERSVPDAATPEESSPAIGAEEPVASDVEAVVPAGNAAADMSDSHAETDDQQSAASASSPTSAETQDSSCAESTKDSTRPSSMSEEDLHASNEHMKSDDAQLPEPARPLESPQTSDEKESVESSSTVVAEDSTPIPATPTPEADDSRRPSQTLVNEHTPAQADVDSVAVLSPQLEDEGLARRRQKRESMVFMPDHGHSQSNSASARKSKRESMVLPNFKRQSFAGNKEKRKNAADPMHTPLSTETSEAEYFSDDSFMEELQSATFEEAKPIQVSKSPVSPYLPRKSATELSTPNRSPSQHFGPGRLSPQSITGRKTSGPWPPVHANTDTVVVAKKINVSSGISQRIRALAEKSNRESNRDSTASVSPIASPVASASLVAQRKTSFFTTPPQGNSPPNAKVVNRLSRASFANLLNPSLPDKQIVQPVSQSPQITDSAHTTPTLETEKPESVQVTAHIVRDARTQHPLLTMPNGSTPLELHQSHIVIDHQKPARTRIRSKSPVKKIEPASPRLSSSSFVRDHSFALPRSSSEHSWRPFSRRMSESKTRSDSTHSFESTDERKEEKKEKKDSRATKLFKRMSNMSSMSSRKNSVASSHDEVDAHHRALPALKEPPPAVQVGDLNVQFPDTLLWKRRWVELDAAGNLVLSLSRSNEQSKGITKRFPLSEFQSPYAPDQDRQELPNSVILDFADGRTLQFACETYVAQVQVLQILREAHDAWIAYNQGQ